MRLIRVYHLQDLLRLKLMMLFVNRISTLIDAGDMIANKRSQRAVKPSTKFDDYVCVYLPITKAIPIQPSNDGQADSFSQAFHIVSLENLKRYSSDYIHSFLMSCLWLSQLLLSKKDMTKGG